MPAAAATLLLLLLLMLVEMDAMVVLLLLLARGEVAVVVVVMVVTVCLPLLKLVRVCVFRPGPGDKSSGNRRQGAHGVDKRRVAQIGKLGAKAPHSRAGQNKKLGGGGGYPCDAWP